MDNEKRAITTDDLTKLEIVSDGQFAPDGNAFTYVTTTINQDMEYESHLFFQRLTDNCGEQWTFKDAKNSHARFSPDGKNLVFQSDRSGITQIWLLRTAGGEAKQITFFKNGAANPEWSRDGQYIIFSADLDQDDDVNNQSEQTKEEREKEKKEQGKQPLIINRLQYKSNAEGFHEEKRVQLVLYHLVEDKFIQLTTADSDHKFEDSSPNSKLILYTANLNKHADEEQTNDLFIHNIATGEVTKLTNSTGVYSYATFSEAGDKIACFGHEFAYSGATLNELYLFVPGNGRSCLSEAWDIQLDDVMVGDTRLGEATTGPVWSQDGQHLYFIATDSGTTGLYQVNLQGDLQTIYQADNHVFDFAYDKEKDTFILGISSPTNPGDFYLLRNGAETKALTNTNADLLADIELSEPEAIKVTVDDGWEIQGWILKPYGFEENNQYPFVLEVHGGPHTMYGQTFFHELQLLAGLGYVVLYTNPRGSHGYGQQFVNACRSDYGGKDYTDLMSAVDFALENYSFIDKERLGVTGGSYGGFMTNWIVSHTNRFKAAVTQRSITNWLSFYGVSDIGYFFTKWELGHNLLDDPQKLWDFSPLKYAANVETPLLIVHGEQDFRCPIEQAEQWFITLKYLRKNVEFVRFPDANHELSRSGKPEMRKARLNHICRWFEKYL